MITAWHNRTPLLVTAGQQDRRHRALEPLLTGELVDLARPYVKRSFEPVRAANVPGEIHRAYHTAMQHPRSPVFVSVPMDDWDEDAEPPTDHDVVNVEGIDFVGVARGLGVEGELVERDEDLLPAIKRALNAGRSYLLDVVVDPEVPEILK